jgi:G3E family GTPase
MLDGFLGAGKTTAVSKLARWLADQSRRVGLITNDQGSQLVDTTVLASRGFPVEEIPGGCFCCRFNSLVEAAQRLTGVLQTRQTSAHPSRGRWRLDGWSYRQCSNPAYQRTEA